VFCPVLYPKWTKCRPCTRIPVWGRNTAKIYGVNTVDGRNYYGRQFASLRARRYGCFTRITVPYKPYCTVTVRSPRNTSKNTSPNIFPRAVQIGHIFDQNQWHFNIYMYLSRVDDSIQMHHDKCTLLCIVESLLLDLAVSVFDPSLVLDVENLV
jgi:hypothetical protein